MKARSCHRSRLSATARKRIWIKTALGSCRVFRMRQAEFSSSPSKVAQIVRVEHVQNEGGQAVIGNVEQPHD